MRLLIFTFIALLQLGQATARPIYNVKDFGAKGNGKTMNTEAINNAIRHCNEQGGGVVFVPEGDFLSGTIELLDNVELRLDKGARLIATTDLPSYGGYICRREGFEKYKMAYAEYWNKALILAVGRNNFAVTGEGVICGQHVENPDGEDHIRGPHTIVFAESRNFRISGIKVEQAGNYAFMGYELQNGVYENLWMAEGYDGIHIRGGKNIVIRNCRFQTGDDAIAGGWWENFVITDCDINSRCNAIRIIYPVEDLEICYCRFQGPGIYPQRSSAKLRVYETMMSAVNIQPGAWQDCEGALKNIHIHDLEIDNIENVLNCDLKRGTWSEDICVERIKATKIYNSALQFVGYWGGTHESVVLRDIDIQYVGRTDEAAQKPGTNPTSIEAQVQPYWGMYLQGIRHLKLENIALSYTGEECRSAIGVEDVFKVDMENLQIQEVEGKESVVSVYSELSPTRVSQKFIPLR